MQYFRPAAFFLMTAVFVSCVLTLQQSEGFSNSETLHSGDDTARPRHSQVIIIGAGPSGVAAASRLMENGVLDVTILEAENRLGGRINTVPFGENVADLGAQWVHGAKDNVVYEMANPLGLLQENATSTWPLQNPQFLLGNGQVPDQYILKRLVNISMEIGDMDINNTNYNGSFGQFFVDKFAEYTLNPANNVSGDPALVFPFLSWVERLYSFGEGADSWFNVSYRELGDYWNCEGDHGINWKNNGYYSVINLLTKRYPHPAQELPVRRKTHFRTEAKTIHWGPRSDTGSQGDRAVLVETSNGTRYTADFVVVTVSLGVLKENADSMFQPSLQPTKREAIKHIGFGHVDKILMYFAEQWWPENLTGFSFLMTDEDRLQFNRSYPQYADKGEWLHGLTGFYILPRQPHSVLYAWIVGQPARNMEKYSNYQVMAGCIHWLEMFIGRGLPWPVSFIRSKWYSNPHFRGSYSHLSLDSEKNNVKPFHLAEPLFGPDGTPTVLFAGEATSDHRYSTVHGAIETGWREADRILGLLGKENRSRKPATEN